MTTTVMGIDPARRKHLDGAGPRVRAPPRRVDGRGAAPPALAWTTTTVAPTRRREMAVAPQGPREVPSEAAKGRCVLRSCSTLPY